MRRIITIIVTFLLGLEIGGFGMWCLTMFALKDTRSSRTKNDHASYQSYKDWAQH